MLSKLRYLTLQSSIRGTQSLLNKTTSDFNNLTKVCFNCDTVHVREAATTANSEAKGCVENDFFSQTDSSGEEATDSTLKMSMQYVKALKDQTRKQCDPSFGNFHGSKMEQNPQNFSKILENPAVASGIQKRELSTSRLLYNRKMPARRSHSDTSMGWLAGLKHLMYGEQDPKAAFAEQDSTPEKASLSYLLWGCDTVEDVMNLVEPRLERKELDISQHIEIMQKLQMIIYTKLGQKHAWLAEDIIPGIYVYLLLNDVEVSEFKYLENSSAFMKLQHNLEEFLDQMTVPQFAACMSGLVWLGCEASNPTQVNFMSKLPEFCDEDFTILSIHILAVCLMSFERPEILLTKYIYPRLKAFMKNAEEIPNDKKTLFSLMFLAHCRLPDLDVSVWLSEQVLKIVEETDHLKDPFLASMALRFCQDIRRSKLEFSPKSLWRNMALDVDHEDVSEGLDELTNLDQKLLDTVITHLMESYNTLSCSDVARVMHCADRMGMRMMPWVEFIHKRSLDLIMSGTLSLGQLAPVISGLKYVKSLDKNMMSEIENLILRVIDKADVSSTAFLLDYVSNQPIENHKLVRACQLKVIEHLDNMVSYRMLSKRMYQFLGKYPMESQTDHMVLQTKLMKVDNISFHDDMILEYLISMNNWIPTSPMLLNTLTNQLGYCSFKDYFRLLCKAVNWLNFKKNLKANGMVNRETFSAITNFEINIGKRYFRAIESMERLSDILYLTLKLYVFNPKIPCMKTLMKMVEKFTDLKPLEESELGLLTKFLKVKEGVISPKMFDRILDSYVSMKEERLIVDNMILQELVCKWFCCEPDHITKPFRERVNNILQPHIDELCTTRDKMPLPTRVRNMESLCLLGVFPKEALFDLLNVDMLSQLDSLIEDMDSSHFKSRAYQRILNINRCIVIDRPDIEIPWFMGDYVDDLKLDSQDVNSDRNLFLKKMMTDAVGADYFGYQRPLEYGYNASFVCLMNKDKKLMPFSENNFRFAPELGIHRRVIEFVYSDQLNTNDMISHKLRQNHLKKLGYELIEIHDHELYSIALARRGEKVAYIQRRILGLPYHPVGPPSHKVADEDDGEILPSEVNMEELEALLSHPVSDPATARATL